MQRYEVLANFPNFQPYFLLVFVFSFGIHRKPALFDPFELLKYLQNRPERGKRDNSEDNRGINVLDHQRGNQCDDTGQQKEPPAFLSQIIFGLDDQRMEKSDGQKRDQADNDSCIVHLFVRFMVYTRTRAILRVAKIKRKCCRAKWENIYY